MCVLCIFRCDDALAMSKKGLGIHDPFYPPLSMQDVEKEAKVITSKSQQQSSVNDQVIQGESTVFYFVLKL